jgi:hyaluronan synthase
MDFFTSVLIPVVDEPLDLFKNVLLNIARQSPSEIIVVINGPKNEPLEDCCFDIQRKLRGTNTVFKYYYTPIAGKRNAIKVAMEHVNYRSDIAVLVDSDTIWTENTLVELLKPFACDENIGGVTTRQKILQPERKLVTMFANLLEEIRAEGTMKAMSVTGKVGCLPGRTIAFRTKILRDVMHEFMHETFMGFHKEVSDDRSLTNLTLKKGYKTVMQDTSVIYTDAPLEWKKFIRQQLRWAEGSQYNNLRMTPWMWNNAKLMFFIYWSDMIMPMLLISVYANMFICKALNMAGYYIPTINYTQSWWVILLFIFIGCILSFGSRNLKVMSNLKWYYTLMIPLFITILTIIMVPVRLLGLMRCSDDMGWGTRVLEETNDEIS